MNKRNLLASVSCAAFVNSCGLVDCLTNDKVTYTTNATNGVCRFKLPDSYAASFHYNDELDYNVKFYYVILGHRIFFTDIEKNGTEFVIPTKYLANAAKSMTIYEVVREGSSADARQSLDHEGDSREETDLLSEDSDYDHNESDHDYSDYDYSDYDYSDYDYSEHDHSEYDHSEYDHSEYDHSEYDHSEYDHSEYDHSDYDYSTHDHSEHDHSEHDHSEHSYRDYRHNDSDYDEREGVRSHVFGDKSNLHYDTTNKMAAKRRAVNHTVRNLKSDCSENDTERDDNTNVSGDESTELGHAKSKIIKRHSTKKMTVKRRFKYRKRDIHTDTSGDESSSDSDSDSVSHKGRVSRTNRVKKTIKKRKRIYKRDLQSVLRILSKQHGVEVGKDFFSLRNSTETTSGRSADSPSSSSATSAIGNANAVSSTGSASTRNSEVTSGVYSSAKSAVAPDILTLATTASTSGSISAARSSTLSFEVSSSASGSSSTGSLSATAGTIGKVGYSHLIVVAAAIAGLI